MLRLRNIGLLELPSDVGADFVLGEEDGCGYVNVGRHRKRVSLEYEAECLIARQF